MIPVFRKEPGARLDFTMDWSTWLKGDTLASATWTVPDGLTKVTVPPPSIDEDGKIAIVWLEGGTAGQRYRGRCEIVTAAGRQEGQDFEVRVSADR